MFFFSIIYTENICDVSMDFIRWENKWKHLCICAWVLYSNSYAGLAQSALGKT